MKHSLSLPVVAVFLVSNWLALTCGVRCGHESLPPADHSASSHAEHTHHPDTEPFVIAGQHVCGTHGQGEAVFSPERLIQVSKLSVWMAVLPESPRTRLPDPGEWCERPWQFDSALSKPQSISLRI